MSEELKPCPFCGGTAKHNDGGNSVYGLFWYAVWCEECQIEMRDRERWAEGAKLDPAYPPKECFARWNSRPDAEKLEKISAIVERAQAIVSTSTYPNWHASASSALKGDAA